MRMIFGLIGLAAALSAGPGLALSASVPADSISVNRPVGASPEFQTIFRQSVASALTDCIGGQPVAVQVEITKFRRVSPNEMGSNSLTGVAKLVDPASRQILANYEITGVANGGPEGVAALTQIQLDLSSSFGRKLCQRAFHAS